MIGLGTCDLLVEAELSHFCDEATVTDNLSDATESLTTCAPQDGIAARKSVLKRPITLP